MHNGRRYDQAEYFDDILDRSGIGSGGNAGILEGAGLDDYDGVKEKVQPDGVNVHINCRHCNSKRSILLEWVELFQVGANGPGMPPLLPPGWQFSQNNGTAMVSLRCPNCGQPGLVLHVTPDEARRNVDSAARAGLISPQQLQSWTASVQHIRGQHRG